MTYEDFCRATDDELRRMANQCFVEAYEGPHMERPIRFSEAQFYIGEIDRREAAKERRESKRVADRDFWMEALVIFLIGLELVAAIWGIVIAVREGKDQAAVSNKQLNVLQTMQANAATQADNDKAAMEKQNAILGQLQEASANTAGTMKNLLATSQRTYVSTDATAKILRALQSTTEAMSNATQGELALFYDVTLNVYWNEGKKQIEIVNTGRTNVSMARVTLDGVLVALGAEKVITPNGLYDMKIELVDTAIAALPKGATKSFPLILYLKNAKQEEFVLSSNVDLSWEGEKVSVRMQTLSIRPEHWSTALRN